ncbi:MAG: hypothetical protein RLZZ450_2805 [Pseudomonadota bacterium]|jgi:uncharacterized protein YegL
MKDDLEIDLEELTSNPQARVPVCLCLDVSGSMEGEPLAELNQGLRKFFSEVLQNKRARYAADVCIVTFGDEVKQVVRFRSIESQDVPVLRASGMTPMGQAVEHALDALEARKRRLGKTGVDYYQPWLVLMTDGQPTDDIEPAVERVQRMVREKKLTVFPIAIGASADLAALARFSAGRAPFQLRGFAFSEFFAWLSKSIVRVSASTLGSEVEMPPYKGWGSLDS